MFHVKIVSRSLMSWCMEWYIFFLVDFFLSSSSGARAGYHSPPHSHAAGYDYECQHQSTSPLPVPRRSRQSSNPSDQVCERLLFPLSGLYHGQSKYKSKYSNIRLFSFLSNKTCNPLFSETVLFVHWWKVGFCCWAKARQHTLSWHNIESMSACLLGSRHTLCSDVSTSLLRRSTFSTCAIVNWLTLSEVLSVNVNGLVLEKML